MSSSTADPDQGAEIEVFELDDADPDPWETAESVTAPRPGAVDGAAPSPGAAVVPAPDAVLSQPPALAAELRALAGAARAGVASVAAILVVSFVGLFVLVHESMSRVGAGFHAFYIWAAWIAGSALDTPVRATRAFTPDPNTDAADLPPEHITTVYDVHATILLLTGIGVLVSFLLARRMERRSASVEAWRVAVRSLTSGLFAALAVLLLAVTSHSPQLLSATSSTTLGPLTFDPTAGPADDAALRAAYAFLGPLLIVFAAALLGRLSVWLRVPGRTPRDERLRRELARWAGSGRVVWLQSSLVGVICGVSLLIYLLEQLGGTGRFSPHMAPIILGGILLLGNLAVLGTFGGFGATVYAGMVLSTTNTGLDRGFGLDQTTDAPKSYFDVHVQMIDSYTTNYGLLGERRPVIVWILLAGAVLGTVALRGFSRRSGRWTGRFAVRAADVPMGGIWRAAVLGGLGAGVALLVGRPEAGVSASASDMRQYMAFAAGPSLWVAVGLGAVWCAVGYAWTSRSAARTAREVSAPITII